MAWPKLSGTWGSGGGIYAAELNADPPRGAVLDLGDYDAGFRLATGEEQCDRDKSCDGCHEASENYQRMSWTDTPVFHDCAVCGDRVMPYGGIGPVMMRARTESGEYRDGAFCERCNREDEATGRPERVWRGDRLVRKDAGPTLRIYDAAGCVLAEGPMRVERTEKGARLHYDGQCTMTGTADCYAVTVGGMQIVRGYLNRGERPLLMTQSFSSGLYLKITMDVNDASEEQLRALGMTPCDCEMCISGRDVLGNDPAQWFARGRRAVPPLFGGGESAFCVFIANLKTWAASPVGQIAARDAAVARAIADVPEGCDGERWANVVRVIAADVAEMKLIGRAQAWILSSVNERRPAVAFYARQRFVFGYSVREATRQTMDAIGCDHCPQTERLLRAYEAGR